MNTQHIILTPGEVVRELREKKGWSQSTLANLVSMAVPNLSNIERGISNIGEERAIILATALGVSPAFILFPNGYNRKDLKAKLDQIQKNLKELKSKKAA